MNTRAAYLALAIAEAVRRAGRLDDEWWEVDGLREHLNANLRPRRGQTFTEKRLVDRLWSFGIEPGRPTWATGGTFYRVAELISLVPAAATAAADISVLAQPVELRGGWSLVVPECPFCEREHFHGGGDGPEPERDGHRVAHCYESPSAGYRLVLSGHAWVQEGGPVSSNDDAAFKLRCRRCERRATYADVKASRADYCGSNVYATEPVLAGGR